MFKPGTIRKIQVKNFVTYSYTEFYPGPNLNMIIGPNGTGKSTMVAAIILGLGGNPKVVGRGSKVSDYVKHNCSDSCIDIFLQGDTENELIKITRHFNTHEKSDWHINGKKVILKEILEKIGRYNIQVDNLCQFLPQDRVQDFAKMNKQELLKATQLALCRLDLIEKQDNLISNRERHKELTRLISRSEQHLTEAQDTNNRLEGKVKSFNRKKKYLEGIQHIDRKMSWVQYEEAMAKLTQTEEDRNRAAKIYENHKNVMKPMEQKINDSKKLVLQLQNNNSIMTKVIRDAEKTIQEKLENQDKFKQAIQRAKLEMNSKLAEFEQRENEINDTSTKIEELKEAQRSLLDKCGNDEQVKQKVQSIQDEVQNFTNIAGRIEDKKEELTNQKQNQMAQLRAYENEINRLENIKQQRLNHLRSVDNHAYEGVLWLRNNKHLFKGEIYEPMMLEINVLDPKNAVYVENVVSMRDRMAFTCVHKEDMNKLIQCLRNEKKLTVNVLHSGGTDESVHHFQPTIPIEQLKKYGLYAYLHTLITAPDPIMLYLCRTYRIHNIPIGNESTNKHFEQIPKEIRLFFSDKCRYSISFSRYTGAKSTKQNEIHSDKSLSISLDVLRLETLQGQIDDIRTSATNSDHELKAYDAQLSQTRDSINQLRSEWKLLHNLKQQTESIGVRIQKMQEKIAGLKKVNTNKDKVKEQADAEIKRIVIKLIEEQREILESFKSYSDIITKSNLNLEKIDNAREKVAYLDNQINESRRLCQEAEELWNQIKGKYAELRAQAKGLLQKSKNLSKGLTPVDPGFAEFLETYNKLPDDQRTLQIEKDELLSKIDCLKIADEGEMKEYEDRLELINKLQNDSERENAELNRISAKMDRLKEDWIGPLNEFLISINYKFASYFEKMGCAGEVSLYTGENDKDYAQYGLVIKVTYRNDEPLQELNNVVQSGGERAVATAAFMLSLQELTPVPFRCVDEINQGMDANNERRIFDLLVDCTTQPNTSQYFLITPKLVPQLRFVRNMMIHIVHNGPFVVADRKWSTSKLCNPQGVNVH